MFWSKTKEICMRTHHCTIQKFSVLDGIQYVLVLECTIYNPYYLNFFCTTCMVKDCNSPTFQLVLKEKKVSESGAKNVIYNRIY